MSAAGVVAATTTGAWRAAARVQSGGGWDVERFLEELRKASAEGQPAVSEVLARAVSTPDRVLAGLGAPKTAGLEVLHHAEDLTVLNVIWAPLMVLLPHNHNLWATIGIYTGREDNILWERAESTIEARKAASLSEKEVFSLGVDAIHSVINPIPRLTGAIHIYGGDFFAPGRSQWDAGTLVEEPFDQEGLREAFREANQRFEAGR